MIIKEEIYNLISQEKPIIFCGAGISRNSGIPIVIPLVRYIFQKLGVDVNHAEKFIESGFVFESFMEYINEKTSIVRLLKVFDNDLFNSNHLLLAKLAKQNLIDIIITTNFDENIEKAFLNEGLHPDKDYEVWNIANSERELSNIKKPLIIKLHGTISELESVSTTISRVSSTENKEPITRFFRQLFSDNTYNKILFLGYSFSDDFDITPALLSECDNSKSLFNVFHIGPEEEENIVKQSIGSGLKKLSIKAFRANTDSLVIHLHKKLFFETITIKHTFDWNKIVDDWFQQEVSNIELKNRHSIIWEILYRKGDFATLEFYLEKFNPAETADNVLLDIDYLTKKAAVFVYKKENEEAIKLYEQAIDKSRQNGIEINIAVHMGNLAILYEKKGNLVKALEYLNSTVTYFDSLKKSKYIKDQITASRELCGCKTSMARIYRKLNRFDEAELVYASLLHDCQKGGFLLIEEIAHSGNAYLKISQNKLGEALECFYKSYHISKNLKLQDRIHHSFKEICKLLYHLYGYEKSKNFYESELVYVKNVSGYLAGLEEILFNR